MNQLFGIKKGKIICFFIDICFLLIHILMFFLFMHNHVTPMITFNIFSIVFYLVMPVFIKLGYLRFFIVATDIEVVIHMTLAIIYTGWGNGFQITLIGIIPLTFFAEYLGRTIRGKYVPALPLGILGMVAYLFSYLFTFKTPIIYELSEQSTFFLQLLWAVVVFVLLIACLQIFTLLSFHSERLLSIAATKDKLTDLPNRHHVAKHEKEYLAADRWIALADIDDFKKINDTYGHNFGDFVLIRLGELMRAEIADAEICRWGGEEFLIIGQGKNMDKAFEVLETFRKIVEKYNFSDSGIETNLTITIGLAGYKEGLTMTEWINITDKKLYVGKYGGKNQIVV